MQNDATYNTRRRDNTTSSPTSSTKPDIKASLCFMKYSFLSSSFSFTTSTTSASRPVPSSEGPLKFDFGSCSTMTYLFFTTSLQFMDILHFSRVSVTQSSFDIFLCPEKAFCRSGASTGPVYCSQCSMTNRSKPIATSVIEMTALSTNNKGRYKLARIISNSAHRKAHQLYC